MLIEKGGVSRAVRAKVAQVETRAYTVVRDFWHAGVLRVEGEVIHLTDAAAKYFRHALERVETRVEDEVKAVERSLRLEAAPARDAPHHDEPEVDRDHGDQP